MEHKGTKRLETERLVLRRFQVGDEQAMFRNWATDSEVTKYLMWQPHESIEVSKEILDEWIAQYGNDDFYSWAIVLKEHGSEPIGGLSVVRKDDQVKMVHIGYCIGRKWWNRGVTSEALTAAIKFFFEEVGVNRIESRHDPRNPNSGKVMMKCGMKYEGIQRQADWNNQGICDSAYYAILAEDYRGSID